MDNAKELYKKAYELHYSKDNINPAYYLYKKIIDKYPNEPEANYSKTQILNIEKTHGFDPESSHLHEEEALAYKLQENTKKENIQNMLMTSGFNCEGYIIKEYIKFISSEVVLGMGIFKGFAASISNFTGSESNSLKYKLEEAKSIVNNEIINQAACLGANAIIGLDIDYTMFGGELLGVIMSGTAVNIEKSI